MTYALVSCPLNFTSWISEGKVTVFHVPQVPRVMVPGGSLTMAGPLGCRGRWHDFCSQQIIVVVYKPGKANNVPDAMS